MNEVITAKLSVIEIVKGMKSNRQIAVKDRKTVKMVNPDSGKNFTSKDKAVLGIEDDRVITWSPANFEFSDSERFKAIASEAGLTAGDLGAMIVMNWFEIHRDEIEAIAGEFLKKENSIDDLQKKMEASARLQAKIMAQIAEMKKNS